jgi:hypothetical protein
MGGGRFKYDCKTWDDRAKNLPAIDWANHLNHILAIRLSYYMGSTCIGSMTQLYHIIACSTS